MYKLTKKQKKDLKEYVEDIVADMYRQHDEISVEYGVECGCENKDKKYTWKMTSIDDNGDINVLVKMSCGIEVEIKFVD